MSSLRQALPPSQSGGLFSIERVVALLTPVLSLAAGVIATVVGKDFGVKLDPASLVALMGIGMTTALAPALKWLHGRSQFTQAEQHAKLVLQEVQQIGGAPLADIEKVLAAHEQTIIQTVGDKLGVSPTAEQIAEEIVKRMLSGAAQGSGPPSAAATTGQGPAGQTS